MCSLLRACNTDFQNNSNYGDDWVGWIISRGELQLHCCLPKCRHTKGVRTSVRRWKHMIFFEPTSSSSLFMISIMTKTNYWVWKFALMLAQKPIKPQKQHNSAELRQTLCHWHNHSLRGSTQLMMWLFYVLCFLTPPSNLFFPPIFLITLTFPTLVCVRVRMWSL